MRNKETIERVLKFIRPYRGRIFLMLVLAVVTVACTLYTPILIGAAVDTLVGPDEVWFDTLMRVLLQIGAVVLITAAAQWLMNLLTNQVTYKVVRDIRSQALRICRRCLCLILTPISLGIS